MTVDIYDGENTERFGFLFFFLPFSSPKEEHFSQRQNSSFHTCHLFTSNYGDIFILSPVLQGSITLTSLITKEEINGKCTTRSPNTYFPSDEIPTILLRSSGLPISKGGFEASKDKRLLNGSQIP